MAVMLSSMISLAAQYPPGGAIFYVLDGTPADSYLAGTFEKMQGRRYRRKSKMVEWRGVADAMTELDEEVQPPPSGRSGRICRRFSSFIYGLQRYRALRKSEDEFSFSMGSSDEPKKANPSKQFADLLREGPGPGHPRDDLG